MLSLKDIIMALIPPPDEDPKVMTFRWLMWATVVGLVATVMWIINNQATASELDAVERELIQVKLSALEPQIFQKSIDVCMSTGPLRTAYSQELSRLIGEWRAIVGDNRASPPTWKSCQELGLQ